MKIQPIDHHETIAESCADQLRRAILAGEVAPGSLLPPERRLAEQLGVNRVTVRSALKELAARGLLSVRQGRGYTVQDFHRTGGPDLLPGVAALAVASGDLLTMVEDLLLVRRQLARAVLQRLTEVRPNTQGVAAAVERFAACIEAGASPDVLVEADVEILVATLEATDSAVLQLCINPIMAALAALPALRRATIREPASNLAGWHFLLGWLEDPDLPGVEQIMAVLRSRDEATLQALREDQP